MRKCFGILAPLLALSCFGQTQQPASAQRLSFPTPEQQAYLDDLVRNAPKTWEHGKNWVRIEPYVLGRTVTQPDAKTVCPALPGPSSDGTEIPPWILSDSQLCKQLATTHDSALIMLEDRNDNDAGYFIFLACDLKRSRNHCDIQSYGQPFGMKLEESNEGGRRQFDVLASTTDYLSYKTKTSRFLVTETWHMRKPEPEPSAK